MLTLTLFKLTVLASAQATYQPAVGDYVEVFRRTFNKSQYSQARNEMLKVTAEWCSRDRLVRKTVMAENAATGEVVALVFSDPYNRGNNLLKPKYDFLTRYEAKRVQHHEFRIFAIGDEGVRVRPGDTVKLYWHSVQPHAHEQMKSALANQMLRSLRTDSYRTNSYMTESDAAGEMLGIGIGEFGPRPGAYSGTISPLKSSFRRPVGRDSLRVFSVMDERLP
jgi:hypothetical protein